MKRLISSLPLVSLISFLASLPAFCEDHDHCLEHHWLSPRYLAEMRLQGIAIGLGMVFWGLILLAGRLRRAR